MTLSLLDIKIVAIGCNPMKTSLKLHSDYHQLLICLIVQIDTEQTHKLVAVTAFTVVD